MLSWITLLIIVASYERFFSLLWQWISEKLDLLETRGETINMLSENAHKQNDWVTDYSCKLFY